MSERWVKLSSVVYDAESGQSCDLMKINYKKFNKSLPNGLFIVVICFTELYAMPELNYASSIFTLNLYERIPNYDSF